ncbi:unnamed protein product [Symbiodinium sp. KB8]|nr:unnamed protein product [Symbiodinium sp. KB8]
MDAADYADDQLRVLQQRKASLSRIKNKQKRNMVYAKLQAETKELRSKMRKKRHRDAEEAEEKGSIEASLRWAVRPLGPSSLAAAANRAQTQITVESMRAFDDTMTRPRTLITTKIHASAHVYPFVRELLMVFPGSSFYRRGRYPLKRICQFAANRGFTHLMVVGERGKEVASLLVVRLADGPTALFRVTSTRLGADIIGHGNPSRHRPEIILNNFSTRLGHRIGRMLGSLFPHDPEFRGRRVVTFHNQRDFVFVRHHRYIFAEDGSRARLQELGPRFTLRLKWLLAGPFDTRLGDFEWFHRGKQLATGRKRFHL